MAKQHDKQFKLDAYIYKTERKDQGKTAGENKTRK